MKRVCIILLIIVCTICFISCKQDTSQLEALSNIIENLSGGIPDNSFLYLYNGEVSYYCFSVNGEKRHGTIEEYYENPLLLLKEATNESKRLIDNQYDLSQEEIVVYNFTKNFITHATNGSSQFKSKLSFENSLPRYTHNIEKCQMISLQENNKGYPTGRESIAYFTIDNLGYSLYYYGQENEEIVQLLIIIEVLECYKTNY